MTHIPLAPHSDRAEVAEALGIYEDQVVLIGRRADHDFVIFAPTFPGDATLWTARLFRDSALLYTVRECRMRPGLLTRLRTVPSERTEEFLDAVANEPLPKGD